MVYLLNPRGSGGGGDGCSQYAMKDDLCLYIVVLKRQYGI